MESRVGWNRALLAAQNFDVSVLYGADFDETELQLLAQKYDVSTRLRFIRVNHSAIAARWTESQFWFYSVYSAWHRRALSRAIELHKEIAFDLVHQGKFLWLSRTWTRAYFGYSVRLGTRGGHGEFQFAVSVLHRFLGWYT